MAATVKIPTQLRNLTDGKDQVSVGSDNLRDVIVELEDRHPGLSHRLLDESGELRRFVNVYVNNEDVRFLDGLATTLESDAEVSIIPAIAGG